MSNEKRQLLDKTKVQNYFTYICFIGLLQIRSAYFCPYLSYNDLKFSREWVSNLAKSDNAKLLQLKLTIVLRMVYHFVKRIQCSRPDDLVWLWDQSEWSLHHRCNLIYEALYIYLKEGGTIHTYLSTTEFLAKVQLNFDLCSFKIDEKVTI